jgi:hypothetical protein
MSFNLIFFHKGSIGSSGNMGTGSKEIAADASTLGLLVADRASLAVTD